MSFDASLRRWLPFWAVGTLLSINAAPALAQRTRPVTAVWSASSVESHFRGPITATMGQTSRHLTLPDTMTFLELRALFASRDSIPQAIQADSVYLLLGSARQRTIRFELEAIGLVGADDCRWTDFKLIAQGALTITLGSGEGFELSRAQMRGPLAITFQKNPNRTCLLFAIPSHATEPLRLHFAGYEAAVTRPK